MADWLNAYVVRQHPDEEALRNEWLDADDRWAARSGWDLTAERERAIAIGEKLGVYRAYPVSKGCTSPFGPIWIHAMVSRKG